MEEEREIGGYVGAVQQLQSLKEYLRKCDFSRLTAREWRRVGTRSDVRLLGEFFSGGTCTNSEKAAAACAVCSELAGAE